MENNTSSFSTNNLLTLKVRGVQVPPINMPAQEAIHALPTNHMLRKGTQKENQDKSKMHAMYVATYHCL